MRTCRQLVPSIRHTVYQTHAGYLSTKYNLTVLIVDIKIPHNNEAPDSNIYNTVKCRLFIIYNNAVKI